jgi:hypothetical protein
MVDKPRRAEARLALGLAIRIPGGLSPFNTESEPDTNLVDGDGWVARPHAVASRERQQ